MAMPDLPPLEETIGSRYFSIQSNNIFTNDNICNSILFYHIQVN